MRWKIPAGVLLALALLIPAAPAVAQSGSPRAAVTSCGTVTYADIRGLVTIDLDTASDTQVRILANQILAVAKAEALTTLPGRIQQALDGTPDDLRAFLKTQLQAVWTTDLRIAVVRTLTNAGVNVKTAAQSALDSETADAYLAYLNDGLYIARARDCAYVSQRLRHPLTASQRPHLVLIMRADSASRSRTWLPGPAGSA